MKLFSTFVAALLVLPVLAAEPDPFDRSSVAIEQQPANPGDAKIVFVSLDGGTSHPYAEHEGFAGNVLLAKMCGQTKGVSTVIVDGGWPKNPETLKGARAVVFFMDGVGKQSTVAHADDVQRLADAGVGIVHLHQVIDYPAGEAGQRALGWLGGVYDPKTGGRGHWDESFTAFPAHEVTRGVEPFKLNDGWILKLKFVPDMKGVTPLLRTTQLTAKPKAGEKLAEETTDNVVCWAYDRPDGGRSFVLTGGHDHRNWALPGLRRLVTNGILWAAKVPVPERGAAIEMKPEELMTNLERKPIKAPKGTAAAGAKQPDDLLKAKK